MNILFINHYAGSPKHGMEYRPYYLAREWQKLGHKVRVVAASESHLHQVKPRINGVATFETIDGIDYVWLKTPTYKGNGIGRIMNMLIFLMRLFTQKKQILNTFVPELVIASSPHPFVFRGAKYIAKSVNAKLVYEVRDLWPLSLIELLGMSRFHPLIIVMQHEQKYAYQQADKVTCVFPKAAEYMLTQGLKADKFNYIPNGIVSSQWDNTVCLPQEHTKKINAFKSKYQFLIGYAGTHGIPNALSHLISAVALIPKDRIIGLVLIGQGPERAALITKAGELGLKNILFLDAVNITMIPAFLSLMDALYLGSEHRPLYRFGISPNKIFDYMMSGKPIIHSVEAGNDPVKESGCGISCAPGNTELIANSILKMRALSKQGLEELGEKGKQYVIKNHDYAVLASKYINQL